MRNKKDLPISDKIRKIEKNSLGEQVFTILNRHLSRDERDRLKENILMAYILEESQQKQANQQLYVQLNDTEMKYEKLLAKQKKNRSLVK